MLILLRTIRVRGERVVDQRDAELEAGALRVGSGPGQDIQVFAEGIAAAHAVVQPQADNRLRIICKRGCRVSVNGKAVGRATLTTGEVAQIGPHRLTPFAPPPGFAAGIEVRIDADAVQPIRDRLRGGLILKLPRVRFYSYVLLLLVAGLGLAVPMLGFYYPDIGASVADSGGPTDHLWSTGALANAHHVPGIADNCNVCHVKPFQQVTNGACLNCHQQTAAHLPLNHPLTSSFHPHCMSCHQEHNEPSTLVMRADSLCTDCHRQSRQRLVGGGPEVDGVPVTAEPEKVSPASAFTVAAHPQFLASVFRLDQGKWQVQRIRLGTPGAQSSSNLKFSHVRHLNYDKVSYSDGLGTEDRPLHCADCHHLDKQGTHFKPITMASTCRACHSLAFDDTQPDRQLPHGDVQALRTYLNEYYVNQAALAQRAGPQVRPRKVPNAAPQPVCNGNPLDCGAARAKVEMNRLFTKDGCVGCHQVYREAGEWQVRPVRLVTNWFPASHFDHRPHLIAGKKVARRASASGAGPHDASASASDSDDNTCLGCHKASSSSHSRDILMPGIKTCATCHGADHPDTVALHCVDCHNFHRHGMPLMDAADD